MGSKGLKFIVADSFGASGVDIVDEDLFDQGRKKLLDALRSHDITKPKGGLNTYGTAVLVNIINEAGAYPTRNFRDGRFEGAAATSGEAIFEGNQERIGRELYNHACSPGCVIQCSNTWHDEEGNEAVSCIEYESTWALGANCGIDDLDAIGRLIWLCNDVGIDTIEAGDTIGVAMDSGLAEFGDSEAAIKWLDEDVRQGTPLGHILGQGTEFTANAFGNPRSPTVKGQGMPAYEPRPIKGIGMTYAISTMGADHTSGYTIAPEILACGGDLDQFDKDKTDVVRAFQQSTAFIDATGHCLFIAFAILDIPEGFEGLVEECNGVLGTNWTVDDVTRIGQEILDVELAFNRAAGFSEVDDRMPEFMLYEPLPPHNVVWDVPNESLDAVFGEA
jgi:aldehyde:ferredoxin oxidoreductase